MSCFQGDKSCELSSGNKNKKFNLCSAYFEYIILISLLNSDRRLADHFGGKLHMGYMLIREKLTELMVRLLFTYYY